ncbi:UvrD-helicase domain-containing protein [Marinobacterium weihaiense]|uniref:DNA 3'-5' helicase n=1 Tax=Marinobacterium weihaiense TaxID=2851016 RepID=A0ABS6MGE6_9GAMM|nr:UvrD-helicase domain-containing protein [Marinobacterium weihaiense]MBV0934787.1 UvrD-helicase domain-containing protein [Marinobacterium weihaiense]
MGSKKLTAKPGFWANLFLPQKWKLSFNHKTPDRFLLSLQQNTELRFATIRAISTRKGLLWSAIEIRSTDRTDVLGGLSTSAASNLVEQLRSAINEHLISTIETDKAQLIEIDEAIQTLTRSGHQYLAHGDINQTIASVPGEAAKAIAHPLFDIERVPQALSQQFPASLSMLADSEERQRYNAKFITSELSRFDVFFSDLDGRSLSHEQREACIRLEDNNLLVASAGSGKTATMVGKVAYVLDKGLYRPEEILVLAFNNDAAKELRVRLAHQLKVNAADLACQVSTFHALGRGIIQQVEGKPPQLANWVEHPAGESRLIEQMINELRQSDPVFLQLWTQLLVLYPKADIPVEVFDSEEDYRRYISDRNRREGATISTLAGVYVKSLQEQRIANWLWLNSIPFEYERQVLIGEEGGEQRYVQPDFYYPEINTYHEHFAINKDGTSPFENYVEHAQQKREGYRQAGISFFETTSAQANNDNLLEVLEAQLSKRGIEPTPRSLDQVMNALEPDVIRRYHNLISVCIKHIRSAQLKQDMLLERAIALKHKARADRFARAVWMLAEAYTRKLEEADSIDFEGMIGNAINLIEDGRYSSPFKLILVDEFQDISEPRANLIKALRSQRPFTKIFAVGDDWQSIYRFAGSDITLFTQFEQYFGTCWIGRLQQTYRCNQLIAGVAAAFVQQNPEQMKKDVQSVRPEIPRSIRVIPVKVEWEKPSMENACRQLLNRLNGFAAKIAPKWQTEVKPKLSVLVLSRYNMQNPFKSGTPSFSHIVVRSMTFHRAKGLEADYSVLLDVSEGNFGVPSRIEDDELLHLVIPSPEIFPHAEERRLFYVAMTRASRGVYLLTNQIRPSRYIDELRKIGGNNVSLESLEGNPIRQCPACGKGHLIQRIAKGGSAFMGCSEYPVCQYTEDA